MEDGVTAEGGNYSNAGLSISRRGRGLSIVTSHCGENQCGRPSETALVYRGLKIKSGWVLSL